MTLPDDWWTTGLEDEPCDGCGVKPSKHAGHGSFTCKACYDAWWCPKCTYALGSEPEKHVCPSPEQREADQKRWEEEMAELGIEV